MLECALVRPVNLLVRVHAAGSGELLQDARLNVGQRHLEPNKARETGRSFRLESAHFDPQAGGFVVSEFDLGVATGSDIVLAADASGYVPSKAVPIASNGKRTCSLTLDFFLQVDPDPQPLTPGY